MILQNTSYLFKIEMTRIIIIEIFDIVFCIYFFLIEQMYIFYLYFDTAFLLIIVSTEIFSILLSNHEIRSKYINALFS